jgi:predicted negative regulator of RcsB-dependent stress response
MSEEFDNNNTTHTSFIPLLIFLAGFGLSAGYQLYQVNAQRMAYSAQLTQAMPVVTKAQAATSKLYAVAQDLIKTAEKDQYAAQIVKEAGISMQGGTNGAPVAPNAPTK